MLSINVIYNERNKNDSDDTRKFKHIPDNIEVCNLGSSHGLYSFCYEDYEDEYTCFNFALVSQTLSYDDRILSYYKDKIGKNTIVFIPISYGSFLGNGEEFEEDFESKNKRYYKVLPANLIKKYNFKDAFFEKYFPSLIAYKELPKQILHPKTDMHNETTWNETVAENDVEMDAKNAYLRHIITNKCDNSGKWIINNYEIDALYDIINICKEREAIPILITTPFLKEYTDEIKNNSPQFINEFNQLIGQVREKTGIEYYNYAMDDRFWEDYSLFMNSDHLNKHGAKKFTEIVLNEINLLNT